jgi:hypothetical protein
MLMRHRAHESWFDFLWRLTCLCVSVAYTCLTMTCRALARARDFPELLRIFRSSDWLPHIAWSAGESYVSPHSPPLPAFAAAIHVTRTIVDVVVNLAYESRELTSSQPGAAAHPEVLAWASSVYV